MSSCLYYANEFVFTLPEEKQKKILNLLTYWHNTARDYWRRSYHAENDDARHYCDKYYQMYMTKIKNCKEVLEILEIYPVIGWAGHRDEYFFPTEADCEMQDDWLYQCSE